MSRAECFLTRSVLLLLLLPYTLHDRSHRLDACVTSFGDVTQFLSNSAYRHTDSDHAECFSTVGAFWYT